jgi:hypothetical protein
MQPPISEVKTDGCGQAAKGEAASSVSNCIMPLNPGSARIPAGTPGGGWFVGSFEFLLELHGALEPGRYGRKRSTINLPTINRFMGRSVETDHERRVFRA